MWLAVLPAFMFMVPCLLVTNSDNPFRLVDTMHLYTTVMILISSFCTLAMLSPAHRYRMLAPDPEGPLFWSTRATILANSSTRYIEWLITPWVVVYSLWLMPIPNEYPLGVCLLSVYTGYMVAVVAHQSSNLRPYVKINWFLSIALMAGIISFVC